MRLTGGALGVAQATESWKLTHCSKHLAMGVGKDRIDREREQLDRPPCRTIPAEMSVARFPRPGLAAARWTAVCQMVGRRRLS